MMCQMIGMPPISTIGLGRTAVSSPKRVPNPPAKITAFIKRTPLNNSYAIRWRLIDKKYTTATLLSFCIKSKLDLCLMKLNSTFQKKSEIRSIFIISR